MGKTSFMNACHLSLALAISLLVIVSNSGCEHVTGASCGGYESSYLQETAQEGLLSASVATEAPYPMTMIVSQVALNRLFAAVSGSDLPSITLNSSALGVPLSVTLHPSLPLLQVGGERGCLTCLLTEMDFGIDLAVDSYGFSGSGFGRFQFPLGLLPNGMESTSVLAHMQESEVLEIDFSIAGIDDLILDAVSPLIAQGATYLIRQEFGDTELFQLLPWTMGDGDVKMLGRGPFINPESRTIAIGIHTNLVQPLSGSVAIEPALPEGADIGMQFHPELIQQMVSRMLFEGHIDRNYNANGQSAESGLFKVSLNQLGGTDNDLLRTQFTLWRTSGSLCGSATLQADLGLTISDRAISLAVDNLSVTSADGVGELLRLADAWMSGPFLEGVMGFSELTINYRELEIPGGMRADMSAESFRLDIGAHGLSVFLNIDNIVSSQ